MQPFFYTRLYTIISTFDTYIIYIFAFFIISDAYIYHVNDKQCR